MEVVFKFDIGAKVYTPFGEGIVEWPPWMTIGK
jgi:hypothetical protein